MEMSKTAALKSARNAIFQPIGHGTSWQVIGPYYQNKDGLEGPKTSRKNWSYHSARRERSRWVANLALCLMGWDKDKAFRLTEETEGSIEDIFNAALYAAMSPEERLDKAIGKARGEAKEHASI